MIDIAKAEFRSMMEEIIDAHVPFEGSSCAVCGNPATWRDISTDMEERDGKSFLVIDVVFLCSDHKDDGAKVRARNAG